MCAYSRENGRSRTGRIWFQFETGESCDVCIWWSCDCQYRRKGRGVSHSECGWMKVCRFFFVVYHSLLTVTSSLLQVRLFTYLLCLHVNFVLFVIFSAGRFENGDKVTNMTYIFTKNSFTKSVSIPDCIGHMQVT